jgi:hypothetical protein
MKCRMLVGSIGIAIVVTLVTTLSNDAWAISDRGQVNAEVLRTNPQLSAWADAVVDFQRGPMDYADLGLGLATFGAPTDVLGSDGTPVSLGDGGAITLSFPVSIENGPDVDIVVFENAFSFGGQVFAELAFVEVSSNGVDFARMPAISRIDRDLGAWDGIGSGETYNLAGNFEGGTGFDLADLVGDPLVAAGLLDLMVVRFVRIVDVIGDRANASTLDALGNAVADPYPTAFASGGFDLTGVAIMNPPGPVRTEARSWSEIKSLY